MKFSQIAKLLDVVDPKLSIMLQGTHGIGKTEFVKDWARNLLGLVYYEIGEVVQALSEWVISANYQPEDNIATKYLKEVHNNRNQLEMSYSL